MNREEMREWIQEEDLIRRIHPRSLADLYPHDEDEEEENDEE